MPVAAVAAAVHACAVAAVPGPVVAIVAAVAAPGASRFSLICMISIKKTVIFIRRANFREMDAFGDSGGKYDRFFD